MAPTMVLLPPSVRSAYFCQRTHHLVAANIAPEHVREAALANEHAVMNRLLRAVAELGRLGRAGELPVSARWILDSRLADYDAIYFNCLETDFMNIPRLRH